MLEDVQLSRIIEPSRVSNMQEQQPVVWYQLLCPYALMWYVQPVLTVDYPTVTNAMLAPYSPST